MDTIVRTTLGQDLIATAGDLAGTFAERAAGHDRDATSPHDDHFDRAEAGFLRMTVPDELGGLGAGTGDLAAVLERLAMGDGATALAVTMHLSPVGQWARIWRRTRSPGLESMLRRAAEGTLARAAITGERASRGRRGLVAAAAVPGGHGPARRPRVPDVERSTVVGVLWADAEFPADPYPGAVPPTSFVHVDGVSHSLDSWTSELDPGTRLPVLTYGSNRCPSKITWLRESLGLGPEPVVVVRVRTTGVAAVWASGFRLRDGQRPAVLAAAPGVVEEHAVWLATPDQISVLDRCEGRDDRFRLARLHTGEVRTEEGTLIEDPLVYLGLAPSRRPLLVRGRPVRCADVPQAEALTLDGEPSDGDGLDADTIE